MGWRKVNATNQVVLSHVIDANCSNLNSYLCAKKNGTGIYKFINIGTWTLERIDLKPKQKKKKKKTFLWNLCQNLYWCFSKGNVPTWCFDYACPYLFLGPFLEKRHLLVHLLLACSYVAILDPPFWMPYCLNPPTTKLPPNNEIGLAFTCRSMCFHI